MRSYIKASYTGNQLILSRAVEMLNTFEPKGCLFQNYTLHKDGLLTIEKDGRIY